MTNELLTKQEVINLYKINPRTFENWIKYRGLPVIEISTHKKYIRKSDLLEFENKLLK